MISTLRLRISFDLIVPIDYSKLRDLPTTIWSLQACYTNGKYAVIGCKTCPLNETLRASQLVCCILFSGKPCLVILYINDIWN